MDEVEIRHDPATGRFHTQVEGHACILDYALADGRMLIQHTVVPPAVGGRGIAGQLVRAALEWARAAGLRVVPRCAYAETYMRRHREYGDLLAAD